MNDYPFNNYICSVTGLTCCGCSLYCEHRREKQMKTPIDKIKKIKNQYDFPIWLIKETLEYHNGDEDKAFEELRKIYSAIGDHPEVVVNRNIKKFMHKANHLKAEHKLDEIRQYLDNNLHPLVSPNNWDVYSDLRNLIDELGELIEEDD